MPYLYIENFEAGLDDRKTVFTAPPGSLRELKNAHISRGKEIERRLAFPVVAVIPTGTIGFTDVDDQLLVFGDAVSVAGLPAILRYQRLVSPNGGTLNKIYSVQTFAGLVYVVAGFTGGSVHHFYDGVLVDDWTTLSGDIGSLYTVAVALSQRLDDNGDISIRVVDNRIVITSEVGVSLAVSTSADLTDTETQASSPLVPSVDAKGSFEITAGSPGTTFNTVLSVKVDGQELISAAVDFVTDLAATALAVADKISTGLTAYSATASGAVVIVTAPNGLGSSANGRVVVVAVEGDVVVGNINNFAVGVDEIPAVPEITEVTVDTYGSAILYTITLDAVAYEVRGDGSAIPLAIKVIKQKMYAIVGSLLYFSGFAGLVGDPAIADPTKWINNAVLPLIVIGAGFIDISTQDNQSAVLTGIGLYQDKVAVFGRRSLQIWTVDPDPNFNVIYQTLINIGSVASDSILEYGDIDIFFLSDSGVRSLRSRDSSNLASTNDVGVSIDKGLVEFMRSVPRKQVRSAKAVIEPTNNRYMLSIGERVYVFSNFPGSGVAAWSTYELGGVVDSWAISGADLYARIGDNIVQYGGLSGGEYDNSETVVVLPFLDASNPAMRKILTSIDAGILGVWKVEVASEPNDPDVWEEIGVLSESTYGSFQDIAAQAESTHFALRLTTISAEAAVIGNLIIHFREAKAS